MTDAPETRESGTARQRPVGLTILSCMAFLSSVLIASICVRLALDIARFLHEPAEQRAGEVADGAYVAIPVALAGCLTLGAIAFAAGADLWRQRSRGKKLTLTSMALFVLMGALLFFAGPSGDGIRWAGLGFLVVGVASTAYLSLPKVRAAFHE